MKRPLRPKWLIRQARELAGQGVGQPRHTNLRRATSAAYYALFHEIALTTAAHLLPGNTIDEQRQASRRVSHRSIRSAADWIAGDTPPKHLDQAVKRLRQSDDLTDVAVAFKELQDEREKADYDHDADLTRPGTHARIEQASRAIRLIQMNGDEPTFRSFFGLVSLKVQ